MSHTLSRSSLLVAGRFALHFVEMLLAMYVGMLIYMPLQDLLPAELQQIGMALFMAWPMLVWMRIRGHAWRHGFEMAAAMLAPWAALVVTAKVVPTLAPLAEWSMYAGMLVYMLFRREHYLASAAHAHIAQSVHAPPFAGTVERSNVG
jgi:flagellar biosynthetic protein FliP